MKAGQNGVWGGRYMHLRGRIWRTQFYHF